MKTNRKKARPCTAGNEPKRMYILIISGFGGNVKSNECNGKNASNWR